MAVRNSNIEAADGDDDDGVSFSLQVAFVGCG